MAGVLCTTALARSAFCWNVDQRGRAGLRDDEDPVFSAVVPPNPLRRGEIPGVSDR